MQNGAMFVDQNGNNMYSSHLWIFFYCRFVLLEWPPWLCALPEVNLSEIITPVVGNTHFQNFVANGGLSSCWSMMFDEQEDPPPQKKKPKVITKWW